MYIKMLLLCLSFLMTTSIYANQISNKNIIIFVSFSMPEESLKGWIREAKAIGAPVIVRGLINNSFKETIEKIGTLTKENHGGIQINPSLFERFQVNKVPAVVVEKESNCPSGMSCAIDFDIIYGDVTLSSALKKISDSANPIIDKASLSEVR